MPCDTISGTPNESPVEPNSIEEAPFYIAEMVAGWWKVLVKYDDVRLTATVIAKDRFGVTMTRVFQAPEEMRGERWEMRKILLWGYERGAYWATMHLFNTHPEWRWKPHPEE